LRLENIFGIQAADVEEKEMDGVKMETDFDGDGSS